MRPPERELPKGNKDNTDDREAPVTKTLQGFAKMDETTRREIASMGGRAAHEKGTAHEWSREQARIAGRKGGLARARHMQELAAARNKENE